MHLVDLHCKLLLYMLQYLLYELILGLLDVYMLQLYFLHLLILLNQLVEFYGATGVKDGATCGILDVTSCSSPVAPSFTPVINLRKAKSYMLDLLPT